MAQSRKHRGNQVILWGIENATHNIVGTEFNPDTAKKGNQGLQIWLAKHLKPDLAFSFEIVEHPQGRIVLLNLPAAHHAPVAFDSTAYIRIGEATPKLSDHPNRFQRLIGALRPYAWEQGTAKSYVEADEVLCLLDYEQYFRLMEQKQPSDPAGILRHLQTDNLIEKDLGDKWNITNLGAILFARNLPDFPTSLARKQVRFIAYGGDNKAANVRDRRDYDMGYASCFELLVTHIHDLIPKNEHIGRALRETISLFPTGLCSKRTKHAM